MRHVTHMNESCHIGGLDINLGRTQLNACAAMALSHVPARLQLVQHFPYGYRRPLLSRDMVLCFCVLGHSQVEILKSQLATQISI